MRHFIIAGLLVIVMAFATYFGLTYFDLLPIAASAQAGSISQFGSIDWLWNLQMIAMSFLFALIFAPMVYSFVAFRRKKGDVTDAEHIEGNTALEITWTIAPLFLVVAFAYFGAYSLTETLRADPNAMVVKVTGSQWQWKFEYPGYGVTTTTTEGLYLPVGHQVVLKMSSLDVIHSFWVPEFRIKQDVVPGRVTEYRVTPILNGAYKVRCAELCGAGLGANASHAYMESPVIVVSQEKFDEWINVKKIEAAALKTPEGQGEQLVAANGCAACHSIDGKTLTGPTWQGLFGSEVKLVDGSTVVADEAFITESIANPTAKVVEGFQPTMPVYPFTPEEIANIVAYIKTLK